MSLSRGQGTVFLHTNGQKTLGREVRTPCYDTKMHVSLGFVMDDMVDAKDKEKTMLFLCIWEIDM